MHNCENNFAPELHEQLQSLNAKLMVIEKKLLATAIRLDSALQYESTHNIDDLLDYDLVVEIECYNGVEDAEPLCILRENVSHLSIPEKRDHCGFYIADAVNHNIFSQRTLMLAISLFIRSYRSIMERNSIHHKPISQY